MAILTANPNPVGVNGPTGTGTTTVSWDTQSTSAGRVFLSLDGAAPTLFAGGNTGSRTGSRQQSVKFGSSYAFTLRQVSNNAALATLTVTVVDVVQQRIEAILATLEQRDRLDPPQRILGLQAIPGPDTLDVSFRTNRPAIPLVQVLDGGGTVLAAAFPLFGGLRTSHRSLLGWSTPLPQGTELRLRVTAAGRPDIFGRARDRVVETRFRTGTRLVDVLFDTIAVHNDGDPGIKASGEFRFEFMASDAGSTVDTWAPDYKGNISSGDPPRAVDRSVMLPNGPREVYARVWGTEYDVGIPEPGAGIGVVGKAGFRGVGSDGSEDAFGPEAWVARVFDVSDRGPGFREEPFSMRTAPLGIDYTVNGRIATIVRPGEGVFTVDVERKRWPVTKVLGRAAEFAPLGAVDGTGSMIGRGDDGSIWRKGIDPRVPVPRSEGWERLAPDPGGAATAVHVGEGRVELVALGPEGDPLALRDGRWVGIGGRFVGALAAAPDGRGGAHLVGLDAEGGVHLGGLDGGWQAIGENVLGELQALVVGEGGLAVLAIDREGRVLHAGSRDRGDIGWLEPLGGPRALLVGARALEDGGIEVGAEDEDGSVHALSWLDWPKRPRRPKWERLGDRAELTAPRRVDVPCPKRRTHDDPCAAPEEPAGGASGSRSPRRKPSERPRR